jgi:hypothetical protein
LIRQREIRDLPEHWQRFASISARPDLQKQTDHEQGDQQQQPSPDQPYRFPRSFIHRFIRISSKNIRE